MQKIGKSDRLPICRTVDVSRWQMLLGGNRGANQPHYCDNRLKPSVFFRFMEAMQQSAVQMGFSEQDARILVQSVALGAAKLVEANPTMLLSTLRENVTSKGGTTAKALEVFEQHDLAKIVDDAMWAAIHRAREMEQSL